jgi:hypothetical protein
VLTLRLTSPGGSVLLVCSDDCADALTTLASTYPSSVRRNATTLEVGVEDFLERLHSIGSWPDQEVTWSEELQHLVRTNVNDARALEQSLAPSSDTTPQIWEAPEGWVANLTDFQARDASRLLSLAHGANFSVPGAGKTRVGLAVFAHRRAVGDVSRLLVIAPLSAFESWETENLECFGDHPLQMSRWTGGPHECDAVLINYERLSGANQQLAAWMRAEPTMLIVDEGHRMKRGQGGVYGRAVLRLAPLARHRLVLTGTPAPNGVVDLQNVMSVPWPGAGRSLVQRATATGDMQAASERLKPLFVRTTKSELDLPEPTLVRRTIPLPPLHRRIYDALVGHYAREAPELAELGRIIMYLLMAADCPSLIKQGGTRFEPLHYSVPPLDPGLDADLRDLMHNLPRYETSPKYLAAVEIATRNASLPSPRKTIVWSTFVRSLLSLELLMAPLHPAVVHGGTEDRAFQLERFREDPDCHVLLTNPATLGEGISLHHVANDAVYVDRDFAAGRYLQSVDRIHRLGLPHDAEVNVTVLIAEHTIDEVVADRLTNKLAFMGQILSDPGLETLADLDEEPDIAGGVTMEDQVAILTHLRRGHT